jgi:hypothetical protein
MRAVETAEIIGGNLEGVPHRKRKDLGNVFASPTFVNVPEELIQGERNKRKPVILSNTP